MKTDCSIAEDLLPLYNEELVHDETADWIEAHLKTCPNCSKLALDSAEPVSNASIPSPINHDKMMSKITVKLSLYQVIFVGISFFLAMQTALLNDSFGFILSYTLLGTIMYLFYKSFRVIMLVAFTPIFIWSLGTMIPDIVYNAEPLLTRLGVFLSQAILGSLFIAVIHLGFALAGAVIGLFILKIREGEE